jgi:hypothetical protein
MDINPSNPTSTSTYIGGRKKYSRPQAMLWSDNSGNIDGSGMRFPLGNEKQDFIICSDHNRGEMSIGQQRIESRQRMVNGTMRSYHIADKINLSVAWNRLPSRSFSRNVIFDNNGNAIMSGSDQEHTVDGGAGGVELLDWYENHYGTFYVFLAYDKYSEFNVNGVSGTKNAASFTRLAEYNEILEMYITNFTYSVEKRGRNNYDMWNITMTLEEA